MSRRIVNSTITLILTGVILFVVYDYFDKSNKQKEFEESIAEEIMKDSNGNTVEYGANMGNMVYDYELRDIKTNEAYKISDFKGKKAYLFFWASWCPYCKDTSLLLQDISEERDDVVIVGINVESAENTKDGPSLFIDNLALTYINVWAQKEMYDTFHIGSFPTSIIVNSDGIIEDSFVGAPTKEAVISSLDEMN